MELNIKNISELRIASFNCRPVKNSVGAVKKLCIHHDIILLQEHWLLPADLGYLNSIDADFISYGCSAVHVDMGLLVGRPYGMEVQPSCFVKVFQSVLNLLAVIIIV
jgi:hypothetical protein